MTRSLSIFLLSGAILAPRLLSAPAHHSPPPQGEAALHPSSPFWHRVLAPRCLPTRSTGKGGRVVFIKKQIDTWCESFFIQPTAGLWVLAKGVAVAAEEGVVRAGLSAWHLPSPLSPEELGPVLCPQLSSSHGHRGRLPRLLNRAAAACSTNLDCSVQGGCRHHAPWPGAAVSHTQVVSQ